MSRLATNGLELDAMLEQSVAGTPEAFAAVVIELLQDRQRRHRLGLAGYEAARARYTWRGAAERMSGLLRLVAAGR